MPNTKVVYCFVPYCNNNSKKLPGKHFFTVPEENKREWCERIGLNKVPKMSLKVCENHLNLEEDLENFMYWKLMKVRPKLKSRFPDGLQPVLQQMQSETEEPRSLSIPQSTHQIVQCKPDICHKSTQVKPKMTDKSISCNLKPYKKSFCTHKPSEKMLETIFEEDIYPDLKGSTISSEITELFSTTDSESLQKKALQNSMQRAFLLNIISKKPFSYIGVPKKYFFLIDFIVNNSSIKTSALNIIITLYKIKQNDTFMKIGDLFQISSTTLWRLFQVNLNILTAFFKQFVFHPPAPVIKRNLPATFKTNQNFANVQAIIDCLEIEIEKPKNPVNQSLTWSTYKNCNTIKYLISATPDGFINYISKGYGGRISDVNIVELSNFLDILPPGAIILADRGFKHLDPILSARGIKLIRPPSVFKDKKSTKMEVLQSKKIASLRIHIERVIRRVRQFQILKPHSTVNNKMICNLDECITIACGLINLQTPIIKL